MAYVDLYNKYDDDDVDVDRMNDERNSYNNEMEKNLLKTYKKILAKTINKPLKDIS